MSRRKIQSVPCVDGETAQERSLADRFLARTRKDLVRLRTIIERARHGDRSALTEAGRVSHSIHGAGAMLGFSDIGTAGGRIERLTGIVMARSASGGSTLWAVSLQQLSESTEDLARALEAARQTASGSAGMFQRQEA